MGSFFQDNNINPQKNALIYLCNGNIYKDHYNFKHCLLRVMLTENFKIENIEIISQKKFGII
jgi:hypothetical protein